MQRTKNLFCHLNFFQKLIIAIISLSVLTVALLIIYALTNSPENIATNHITTLASDYYENYFYPSLTESIHSHSNKALEEVLSPYVETGFTRTPLRQILSHTNTSQDTIDLIAQYCDINTTFVQYFPTAPFSTTSYTAKFTYSCNF